MQLFRTVLLLSIVTVTSMPVVASAVLEEVMVTATRRAELAQDVPVALTALSGKDLNDAAVVDITDVGFLSPNVQLQPVSTFPGFATFSMRGVGVGANSIRSLDPAVTVND